MINISDITTDMLEDYRFCPVYYHIKSTKDKSITRVKDIDDYYESIKLATQAYFEAIFVNNTDPREKDFLNLTLKLFDRISRLTSEEKFLNTHLIDKMITVAGNCFKLVEPLLNNSVLHPVRHMIHLAHGKYQVIGRSLPIVIHNRRPKAFYVGYSNTPDSQLQFTDINLASYIVWLHDNAPDVNDIVYLNLKKLHQKFVDIPINYKITETLQQYITNMCVMMSDGVVYPSTMTACESCINSCVGYM